MEAQGAINILVTFYDIISTPLFGKWSESVSPFEISGAFMLTSTDQDVLSS